MSEWVEQTIDESVDGQAYCYFQRKVGPWTLEVFPPESSGDQWYGVCEIAGRDIEVGVPTKAEAMQAIETAVTNLLQETLVELSKANGVELAERWHTDMLGAGWVAQENGGHSVVAYYHPSGARIEGNQVQAWRSLGKVPPKIAVVA